MALSSSSQKRTATIVTDLECHLGILDKKTYVKCLKDVSERAKRWNMNFVLSQKVFSSINQNIFQRNYFNNFVHRKLSKGEFLIKEGQEADRIFVIKDGQYEVTIKKANVDLYKLIRKLGGDSNGLFQDLDFAHENQDYVEFMTLPKSAKIEIINETDIIGLDDIVLNNKYIFSIEVISIKGEIFELQRKFFYQMLKGNEDIQINNDEFCSLKRYYWTERIKTTVESRVNFFKTFKEEKIFKDEEKDKEQNQIKIAPNTNDLRFKNKINLNSTFCFSSLNAIYNPEANSIENTKNEEEIKPNNDNDKKNKNYDAEINDISKKIYEKAMKQHPDYKRKVKLEALKKLKKAENSKNSNSALKLDFTKIQKLKNSEIPGNFNNNSTQDRCNNAASDDKNFIWKNAFNLHDKDKKGRNYTSNTFKTGLPSKEYYSSTDRVFGDTDNNFKTNYFSFDKINKNPNLLKKEILNNLLHLQSAASDINPSINKSYKKHSNSDLNQIYNKSNYNYYINLNDINFSEKINLIENANIKNLFRNSSYQNFKNNSMSLNINMDENQKDTQLTISVEKTNNNEKINDLMRETEPNNNNNNTNLRFNNTNLFMTDISNKRAFEAPICAGINVTKLNFNLNSNTNFSSSGKNKNLFETRSSFKNKNSGIATFKSNSKIIVEKKQKEFIKNENDNNKIKLNHANKESAENKKNNIEGQGNLNKKQKDRIEKSKNEDSKSYFSTFKDFNDASLSSLSRLKIKDKTLNIPMISGSSEHFFSSSNFKNKIKKVYNQNGKMIQFISAQRPLNQINKTEIIAINNMNNITKLDINSDSNSEIKKQRSERNKNYSSKYKTISLSNQAKKFSRNSNINSKKNENNTNSKNGASDNTDKFSNKTNKKIHGSMTYSTEIFVGLEEEEDAENHIINSNNSFENKQIGKENYQNNKKNIKNKSCKNKIKNNSGLRSDNFDLIKSNDEFDLHEDKKTAQYSQGSVYNFSDRKRKEKILAKLVLKKNSNSNLFDESQAKSSKFIIDCNNISNSFVNNEKKKNLKIKISNEIKFNKNIKSSFYNSKSDLYNYETFFNNRTKNILDSSFYKNGYNPKQQNSSSSIDFYPKQNMQKGLELFNIHNNNNNSNMDLNNYTYNVNSFVNGPGSFEENEPKRKLYLMDELDRATRLSKFNSYSVNQDLNRIIYDKIFSGILNNSEKHKPTDNTSNNEKKILKSNDDCEKNKFIDYLAIDKFNEIYAKSYKKTIGLFNEKCHSSKNTHPDDTLKKQESNDNLIEKIKNSGCCKNELFNSKNFENTKYLNMFSPMNFGKFNDTIRFKSTSTSRFLMFDKAKKIYQPKKLMNVLAGNKDSINNLDF